MAIEKMTPDEVIETLEYFHEIIPILIFLIKLGQHASEAVDHVDTEAQGLDPEPQVME